MAFATLEDALRTYADRPPKIQAMLMAAYTHPSLRSLSPGTFSVLLGLISRLPAKNPSKPFLVRGDRCAEEADISRKTFSRAVAKFLAEGILLPDGGGRAPSGRWGAMRYLFSSAFLKQIQPIVVNLPTAASRANLTEEAPDTAPYVTHDGPTVTPSGKNSSLDARHQSGLFFKTPYSTQYAVQCTGFGAKGYSFGALHQAVECAHRFDLTAIQPRVECAQPETGHPSVSGVGGKAPGAAWRNHSINNTIGSNLRGPVECAHQSGAEVKTENDGQQGVECAQPAAYSPAADGADWCTRATTLRGYSATDASSDSLSPKAECIRPTDSTTKAGSGKSLTVECAQPAVHTSVTDAVDASTQAVIRLRRSASEATPDTPSFTVTSIPHGTKPLGTDNWAVECEHPGGDDHEQLDRAGIAANSTIGKALLRIRRDLKKAHRPETQTSDGPTTAAVECAQQGNTARKQDTHALASNLKTPKAQAAGSGRANSALAKLDEQGVECAHLTGQARTFAFNCKPVFRPLATFSAQQPMGYAHLRTNKALQAALSEGVECAQASYTNPLAGLQYVIVPQLVSDRETSTTHRYTYVDLQVKRDQWETSRNSAQKPNPLPSDVVILKEHDLNEVVVYKLMGQATKLGHRLGDVVQVALPHLKRLGLCGHRAYRYLLKMIQNGGSYRQKVEWARQQTDAQQAKIIAASRAARHAGKRWVTNAGHLIEVHDHRADIYKTDGSFLAIVGDALRKLYDDIESGIFKPYTPSMT